jgi:undecaprenyl-diphosphatase
MGFDVTIFRFFNDLVGISTFWDAAFEFLALNTFWIMWLVFIIFLIASFDRVTDPLMTKKRWARNLKELKAIDYQLIAVSFISSGLSYLANQVIGLLRFRNRPFAILENVNKLIDKSALDPAFPSTHTALAFALAFSVWVFDRKWGTLFIVLALVQGLARIVSGVHFLTDIIGGIIVAGVLVWISVKLVQRIGKK